MQKTLKGLINFIGNGVMFIESNRGLCLFLFICACWCSVLNRLQSLFSIFISEPVEELDI